MCIVLNDMLESMLSSHSFRQLPKKNHQKFVTEYGHVFIFIHTYGGVCVCGRICIYKNKSYNFCSKKRLIKSFAIVHMLVNKILSLTEFELCVRIRW